MMGRTHMVLGANTLWLLSLLSGVVSRDSLLPLGLLAAFGALLPDLDAEVSTIKFLSVGGIRPFAGLSRFAYQTWGHRGLLHSPVGLALAAIPALCISILWGGWYGVALWLGYAGHLAADACTRSGIPLRPADRFHRLHLLPPRLRLTTGSPAEEMVFVVALLCLLLLALRHLPYP